jgi:hypothetical protein
VLARPFEISNVGVIYTAVWVLLFRNLPEAKNIGVVKTNEDKNFFLWDEQSFYFHER